ncbi:DUF881 domain-containing protein [Isoptericola sp. AK164]|uniref:DUF881 domain-containing protein n=1 Tax=Isoptericola sp. AK164 TaxID=3024246 RepID=UPI0024183D60|nr:DUF881 domain-containing protein [Isoptericola sp. AK164]
MNDKDEREEPVEPREDTPEAPEVADGPQPAVDPLDRSVPVERLEDRAPAQAADAPEAPAGDTDGADTGISELEDTPPEHASPEDAAASAPEDEQPEDERPEDAAASAPEDEQPEDERPEDERGAPAEQDAHESADADEPADAEQAATPATGWRALGEAMHPRGNRSQLLAAVLCAALGFALVVQVQQSSQDPLSSARQDDLVRLLDEVTQRAEQLGDEVADLTRTRDELASGTGQAQAALELAENRATSEGILSGRLPAVGPGLEIRISDPQRVLAASKLFNMLEELRNAGAEVVAVNDVRLVTSTWFMDGEGGVIVDGRLIEPPYRWQVIGDPATLTPALEIPGGALAAVRNDGAEATTVERDEVEISAVRVPSEPQYATPQRPEE